MTEDSRESGRRVSSTVDVASGDGSLFTALSLRDEETLSLEEIKVEYASSGSVAEVLEVYDEPEAITPGDEEDRVEKFHTQPGDRINPDMVYEDVENDVLVTTDGNQDAEITVTVGGYIVTG